MMMSYSLRNGCLKIDLPAGDYTLAPPLHKPTALVIFHILVLHRLVQDQETFLGMVATIASKDENLYHGDTERTEFFLSVLRALYIKVAL
jgi:hypothetical protein